jgi:hypothetical protein
MRRSVFNQDTFSSENKPWKREIEREHALLAQRLGISGNVMSLTGPEVIEHFVTWMKILGQRKHFVICERNPQTFEMMKGEIATLKDNDFRVRSFAMDVFDAVARHGQPLAVLDLDFCATVHTLIEEGLFDNLEEIARNHMMKRTGSCLIITVSSRGHLELPRPVFYTDIIDIFERNDYVMSPVTPHDPGYKGGVGRHGCTMYSVMYLLRGNYNAAKRRRQNNELGRFNDICGRDS